jgi:Excreted virulence factor EspC, type VII ESX diderm
MGSTPGLYVDPAAVRAAATTFEASAGSLAAVARLRLGFGATVAGRGYATEGALLRDSLDTLVDDLRAWARSCAEIGTELRLSAERYDENERATVTGLG